MNASKIAGALAAFALIAMMTLPTLGASSAPSPTSQQSCRDLTGCRH